VNGYGVNPVNPVTCTDCHKDCTTEFLTEINPPGGFGRRQVLVCDECMKSGRWNGWKAQHQSNG
jgi:hypothetical protein